MCSTTELMDGLLQEELVFEPLRTFCGLNHLSEVDEDRRRTLRCDVPRCGSVAVHGVCVCVCVCVCVSCLCVCWRHACSPVCLFRLGLSAVFISISSSLC
jgi:hypothetical protein